MKTRQIAYTAIIAALSVLILYLSSVIPTTRVAMIAVAGILPAILVEKYSVSSGFVLYIVVSMLALLLIPNKGGAILYIVLFGHYPMFKSLIERLNKLWLEWVLKLALIGVLLTVLLLINIAVFGPGILEGIKIVSTSLPEWLAVVLLYIMGTIAFVIYDIGFTRLIGVFISRITKQM